MNQRRYLAALSDAVRRHRAELIRVAKSEGVAGEDALDVVQRAFESVLESDAEAILASPEDARRWLTAVTRNLARNHRRLHAHARPHVSDDETLAALEADGGDPETRILDVETLARLGNCLKTLASTQRAVVRLRMLEEQDGDDVAETLGITRGHVAVLLHRAKASLRLCMTA